MTLVELCTAIAVLAMLGLVIVPIFGSTRHQMRGQSSAQKLMSIGQGGMMYAQENGDRLFSYTWRAGETYVLPNGQLRTTADDRDAAAYQNQEILMRRTGRIDGDFRILNFNTRVPHRRFTHLVLMDYLGQQTDSQAYIDPNDEKQLVWTSNPLDYGFGSNVPYANISDGYDFDQNWQSSFIRQRWAFSSSYQVVPDAWQQYALGNRYIPMENTPHLFTSQGIPDLHTGQRLSRALHPSNKVWVFEEFDRDRAQALYFGYDEAQCEKLMFDGSVNRWASGDAFPSVVIEYGLKPWEQRYVPLHRFPRPVGDETSQSQRWRWTYGGLSGINYGPFSFDRSASPRD